MTVRKVSGFGLTREVVLGSTRQDLAVGLQCLKHRLPLALVFLQVPEQVLVVRLVLAYPLQTPFDETLTMIFSHVRRVSERF